jgi:glycosyltransferase EpsF
MDSNEPIRVAQIVGKWLGGGVEAFLMNYYRNIDKNKIQFDFIVDKDSTCVPKEEIESLGGRVIEIPPYQQIFSYIKELTKILRDNNYKIVHSNINALSVFPLFCAKRAGVPIRIAHSHSTTNKKEWKKNLLKSILKPFSRVYSNEYFCCTEHAGRWLFGNKLFDSGKVKVINNAIDVDKFTYNEETRNRLRKELNVENKFVIGHIGRFIPQKNHEKIISIFNDFHKKNNNSALLLIGEGALKEQMKQKVKDLNLEKDVIFLGQRDNVNEYYQAMDLFLFPSLYEGLGMVMIEAQCSNLPCIASTEVPKIVKINDNVQFIGLNEDNKIWVKNLEKNNKQFRISKKEDIIKSNYDIKTEVSKLERIYMLRS